MNGELQVVQKKHLFYLWNLGKEKKSLAIINSDEMNRYVPENRESGEWESVKIPFNCFYDKFTEWGDSK